MDNEFTIPIMSYNLQDYVKYKCRQRFGKKNFSDVFMVDKILHIYLPEAHTLDSCKDIYWNSIRIFADIHEFIIKAIHKICNDENAICYSIAFPSFKFLNANNWVLGIDFVENKILINRKRYQDNIIKYDLSLPNIEAQGQQHIYHYPHNLFGAIVSNVLPMYIHTNGEFFGKIHFSDRFRKCNVVSDLLKYSMITNYRDNIPESLLNLKIDKTTNIKQVLTEISYYIGENFKYLMSYTMNDVITELTKEVV